MLCYTRYLLKHLLGPAIFITLSLTAIVWLAQSLRFIDLIVNRGLSVSLFIYLTTLLMPSLLSVVLPIALFCAVIYAYHRLLSESELVVLESVGLSKLQLARPAIYFGLAATALSYLITLYLLPVSYREFKDLQFFIRNNYASLLLQEGVFNSPTRGLTVYIRKREPDGSLSGILVHDNTNTENPMTMMAKKGLLANSSAGPQIVLDQGNRQEVNHETGQLSLLHFERYTVNLSTVTEDDELRQREPEELFIHELLNPDSSQPERIHSQLRAEAHQRLTWPLYSIIMPLIALGGLLSGQFNRRGQWKRILGATVAAIGVVSVALALSNAAAQTPALIATMYLNLCLIGGLALWLLVRTPPPPRSYAESLQ